MWFLKAKNDLKPSTGYYRSFYQLYCSLYANMICRLSRVDEMVIFVYSLYFIKKVQKFSEATISVSYQPIELVSMADCIYTVSLIIFCPLPALHWSRFNSKEHICAQMNKARLSSSLSVERVYETDNKI